MSDESVVHVVRNGEHLEQIASRYGTTAADIWKDPANATLKALRPSWNVLAAGDVVSIKKSSRKWATAHVGTDNNFKTQIAPIKISVRLQDENGPIKNEKFVAHTRLGKIEGTTGSEGACEFSASVLDATVKVELVDRRHNFVLRVGGIDPVDTDPGLASRLHHLGYLSDQTGPRSERLHAALVAFQTEKNIDVTGEADAATLDALRDAFGC